MANYESIVLSNVFRVKNPKEVLEVFTTFGFEESYIVSEERHELFVGSYEVCFDLDQMNVVIDNEENVVIGVSSDFIESPELFNDNIAVEDNGYHEQPLAEYLQEQLLDDNECIYIKEIGHEKLRYAIAVGVLITKDNVQYFSLDGAVAIATENKYHLE